jgi:hypothetical protein
MVHSLTFFCTLGSMTCDSHASFLARTLASLCLGREPKAKVVTHKGHHFISMAMEVHSACRHDMDHFIKECAHIFHNK